jgi:hypothetical protein
MPDWLSVPMHDNTESNMEREFGIGNVRVRIATLCDGTFQVRAWLPNRHASLSNHVPEYSGWAPRHEYPTASEALAKAEALAAEYSALDAAARAREHSAAAALEALIPSPVDADSILQAERNRISEALSLIPRRSGDGRITLKQALLVVHPL